MNFVSERIREEDKEYYYSLNPTTASGDIREAYWWAIDKESGNYLYSKWIRNPQNELHADGFGLFVDRKEIVIEAICKMEKMKPENTLKLNWNILSIRVPKQLFEIYSHEELKTWIKEAVTEYGVLGFEKERIREVIVNIDIDLENAEI